MIWSGVVDIETLKRLFLVALFVSRFSKRLISLGCVLVEIMHNDPVECNINQLVFFASCQLQHIASYQFQHTPRDKFGFTDQNLNRSFSAVCFDPTVKAFMAPTIGNDTQLHVIKLPHTFLPLLQRSLFSSPPDDAAG